MTIEKHTFNERLNGICRVCTLPKNEIKNVLVIV